MNRGLNECQSCSCSCSCCRWWARPRAAAQKRPPLCSQPLAPCAGGSTAAAASGAVFRSERRPRASSAGVRPAPTPDGPGCATRRSRRSSAHSSTYCAASIGSEDCLYLSVYSPPQCTRERPCATLFWIYGGAWTIGGNGEFGLYTGEHLAEQHGVVVVAANYRLDVLGWLALEDLAEESGYGNYGLRDQRLAMQWTRDNVAGFGGDPERVTIFGESAGGFSVCQHLTAPASNGLFSRAIIESGGCSGPWLIQDGVNAKRFGDSYATAVGCAPDAVPGARARCMRRKTPAQVMEPYTSWLCPPGHRRHPLRPNDPWCNISAAAAAAAPAAAAPSAGAAGGRKGALNSSQPQPQLQPQLQLEWPSTRPPLAPVAGWTAVVDGTAEGLLDTPLNLIKQGRINSGPKGQPLQVIIGTNQDEMALFIAAMDLLVPGVALPPQPEALPKLVRRKTLHFASLHVTPCHVFPFHFRQQKAPLF